MAIEKENYRYHFILFLISPVLGLVYAIKSKSWTYIRWSIFIFVVIFGSTLHPSFLGDGETHFLNIQSNYFYISVDQFFSELSSIFRLSPSARHVTTEPYAYILFVFVGSILGNTKLLFLCVGLVFGYFYSGAIVRFLKYVDWNSKLNTFYFIYFLIIFLLWQSPANMQSIRNTTALWVLIFAVLSYHQTGKKKFLFLTLLPPLFHIGYLALALPIWLVLYSGFRNPKIYFAIFIFSMLVTNVAEQTGFNDVASQTEVGASKVEGYTVDEERAEKMKERKAEQAETQRFYKTYKSSHLQYLVLSGVIIFIFIFLRQIGFSKSENTLFSYGLASASVANFLSFNYAIYNRSWQIAGIFILALLVVFLSKHNLRNIRFSFLKVKLPLFLFSVLYIPYIFYLLSNFINLSSFYIIAFPFINWINFDMGISIRGVIGYLI